MSPDHGATHLRRTAFGRARAVEEEVGDLTRSLLLVSYFKPSRGHAGGLRLLDLYAEIRRLSTSTRIELLTCENPAMDWGCDELGTIFDKVHLVTPDRFGPAIIGSLAGVSDRVDFIDLQFHQSGALISACRQRWPEAIIAFSPMESRIRCLGTGWYGNARHVFKRLCRLRAGDAWSALQEASYVRLADRVIVVSRPDEAALAPFLARRSLHCVPTGVSQREYRGAACPISRLDGPTVAFSAYFGSRTNREALEWFCTSVHPLVRKHVPGYILKIIGRGLDGPLMQRCTDKGIEFVGQVDFLYEALATASVGIAPALSGGGTRGKIHQYADVGVPCVASPIASEGLDYVPGESIFLASDAVEFAMQIVRLLSNSDLRRRVGLAARTVCTSAYTWRSMTDAISAAYNLDPRQVSIK